tara:strand:+ start:1121 stop:2311 length:1191 start_codon:yes stop_codon:yes gene_type:complete
MLINIHRLVSNIPIISFLLLFPGFFIYQMLLSQSQITGFLGGYFGYMSLILFIPLILVFLYHFINNTKFFAFIDYFFIFLMLYIAVIALYHFSFGRLANNYEMLEWSISGIIFNIECYVIAKFSNFENSIFKKIILFLFLYISFIYLTNLDKGVMVILNSGNIDLVSYQGFARSIVIHASLLIFFLKSNLLRLLILLLAFWILITLGSRSETIIFFLSLSIVFLLNSVKSLNGIILALVLITVSASLVILNVSSVMLFIENTRFYEFFTVGIFNSSSSSARALFLETATQYIYESPFFGNYGAYLFHFGSIGAYPHNLMSAWLNLGLFGFISYIIILFRLLQISLKRSLGNSSPFTLFALFASIFIVLSFMFSKSYLFMFFGIAVGACSNIFLRRN